MDTQTRNTTIPITPLLVLLMCMMFMTGAHAEPWTGTPEIEWTMDAFNATHIIDGSGNNNHASYTSSVQPGTATIVGNATTFIANSSDPYFDYGTPDLGNSFSFCAFYEQNDDSTSQVIMDSDYDASGGITITTNLNNPGDVDVYIEGTASSYLDVVFDDVVPEGQPSHVCIVYDGGTTTSSITVYVNGTNQTPSFVDNAGEPMTGFSLDKTTAFFSTIGGGQPYDGIADEVNWYKNQTMTQANATTFFASYEEEEEPPQDNDAEPDISHLLRHAIIIIAILIMTTVLFSWMNRRTVVDETTFNIIMGWYLILIIAFAVTILRLIFIS